MNSFYIVIFSLSAFYIGYRYYSAYLQKNYNNEPNLQTPAHLFNDGTDYVPTKKNMLFGHHFTSIAGAAPIIGPCIAVYWGWLPAVLWVVLGSIFMGAVHDFGALVISLKQKGKSIADIAGNVINKRIRVMFLLFVMCLTWLVLAVFAKAIAGLFVNNPSSVLPINIEIVVALVIGYLIYKKKVDSFIPSLFAIITLYVFIWLGTIYPIELPSFGFSNQETTWIVLLFIYSAIASLLPVWILLQPRDYINSHQLIVGLSLIFISILFIQPDIKAPAVQFPDDAPPIIPFLFVTIACGAISGFHGLVSSGTTSKQIDRFEDARQIGYGGMLGESSLAIASIIASVAGISLVTSCDINDIHYTNLQWKDYYSSWVDVSNNKAYSFVLGSAALLEKIGLSVDVARTLISVMVISFAATTLDTATRIQRMIITEFGKATRTKSLQNRYIATAFGIIPALYLTVSGSGAKLWPLFGASNQMLASITLMVLTIYFLRKKKNILPFTIPMALVMSISIFSLFTNAKKFIIQNQYLLFTINILLIILIVWMIIEFYLFLKKINLKNE